MKEQDVTTKLKSLKEVMLGDIRLGVSHDTLIEWIELLDTIISDVEAMGEVIITCNEGGEAVAVTRQDDDHHILSVIWERDLERAKKYEAHACGRCTIVDCEWCLGRG